MSHEWHLHYVVLKLGVNFWGHSVVDSLSVQGPKTLSHTHCTHLPWFQAFITAGLIVDENQITADFIVMQTISQTDDTACYWR